MSPKDFTRVLVCARGRIVRKIATIFAVQRFFWQKIVIIERKIQDINLVAAAFVVLKLALRERKFVSVE